MENKIELRFLKTFANYNYGERSLGVILNEGIFENGFYELIDFMTLWRGISRTYGEHKIRFPTRNARYYPADYEPSLFRFLKQNLKAGDIFWDCGAHFGLFSVVASRLVGPTGLALAFEPTPSVREVLTKVVSMNKACNVIVLPGSKRPNGRNYVLNC